MSTVRPSESGRTGSTTADQERGGAQARGASVPAQQEGAHVPGYPGSGAGQETRQAEVADGEVIERQAAERETAHRQAAERQAAESEPTERQTTERPQDEHGVGELVSRATQQLSDLVRAELRLAVAELKDKGRHAGTGAGLFGGAGLVALFGAGALVAAVIAALALVLPVWLSALIIGAALLLVAGVLALLGRSQAKRAVPPMPRGAVDSTRQDVAEIKGRAHP